jgi:hypothetical protein
MTTEITMSQLKEMRDAYAPKVIDIDTLPETARPKLLAARAKNAAALAAFDAVLAQVLAGEGLRYSDKESQDALMAGATRVVKLPHGEWRLLVPMADGRISR